LGVLGCGVVGATNKDSKREGKQSHKNVRSP